MCYHSVQLVQFSRAFMAEPYYRIYVNWPFRRLMHSDGYKSF